jgi:hypothetical protein
MFAPKPDLARTRGGQLACVVIADARTGTAAMSKTNDVRGRRSHASAKKIVQSLTRIFVL